MAEISWHEVRRPGPVEHRCIVRQKYKFYNNLLVAGIYRFPASHDSGILTDLKTYAGALRSCLEHHPLLNVVVKSNAKKQYVYAQASHVDIRQHFNVLTQHLQNAENAQSEDTLLGQIIQLITNKPELACFDSWATIPGWRMDVLPLNGSGSDSRVFISFTFSHCIGDGMSGVNFHKTFSKALTTDIFINAASIDPVFKTTPRDLPMLPHLPISPSYLLGPALGHYLPQFVADFFGLKASTSGSDNQTWTGETTFLNSASHTSPVTTCVEILRIDPDTLSSVLDACRKYDSKLTALLNEIIACCLAHRLLEYSKSFEEHNNIISCTPTNLRRAAQIDEDQIGVIASASYTRHTISHFSPLSSAPVVTDDMWRASCAAAKRTAQEASTLRNQPVGLLAWISDIDAWMRDQLDHVRDNSFQVSNLMAFERPVTRPDVNIHLEQMLFCQPADACGSPLNFNTISVKGGDLVICAGWQLGVLGLDKAVDALEISTSEAPTKAREKELVRQILTDLKATLQYIAR